MTIEQSVKQQCARVFRSGDWPLFKQMAEQYLRQAAYLRTADLRVRPGIDGLLVRNSQKRLFIGIGVELLLKAAYLRYGVSINTLEDRQPGAPAFPHSFAAVAGFRQVEWNTYMLGRLIDGLGRADRPLSALVGAEKGLRIAKVFRNKEGTRSSQATGSRSRTTGTSRLLCAWCSKTSSESVWT